MKNQDRRFYAAFGQLVRRERTARKMTQGDLADRVGLARTSITNIEKGNQQVLLHQFALFCAALSVSPEDLMPGQRVIDFEEAIKLLPPDTDKEVAMFLKSIVSKS